MKKTWALVFILIMGIILMSGCEKETPVQSEELPHVIREKIVTENMIVEHTFEEAYSFEDVTNYW